MVRKKRQIKKDGPGPEKTAAVVFNQPFGALADLKKTLAVKKKQAPAEKKKPATPPPPPPPADEDLFRAEMADVAPLAEKDKRRPRESPPPTAWETPKLPNEDLEVLRSLSDLISGRAE